jgi:hypothetical protein
MARAMRRDIQEDINEQSNLLVPEFATNFSNRLLIHHATHAENSGLATDMCFYHGSWIIPTLR